MNELWKNIKGFEDLYQVSSLGQVKRLISKDSIGRVRNEGKEYIMIPQNGRYQTIRLSKNAFSKTYTIHRLVADAFLGHSTCCPTCGTKLEVNHKDNDSHNNQVTNLEYVSRKENIQLALQKTQKACWKKLSAENVRDIKNHLASKNMTNMEIALKFNVSKSTICCIKKGRLWKSVN